MRRSRAAGPRQPLSALIGADPNTSRRARSEHSRHQAAFLAGSAVDPACLAKAETKFSAAIAKADGAGSCPGMGGGPLFGGSRVWTTG